MEKRIDWIDSLKGIGILLVMLAHTNIPEKWKIFILTFHMPLFFFISGFLFNPKKYNNTLGFLKKKLFGLIIPYFFLSIILYFYWIVFENRYFSPTNIDIFRPIAGIFYGVNQYDFMPMNDVLWFIPCLFVVELLFYFINKYSKNDYEILIFLVLSSILGYLCMNHLKVRLPWSIDTALSALPFYGVAYLISKNKVKSVLVSLQSRIVLIMVCFYVTLKISYINGLVAMVGNLYKNFFYFYIGAFIGIILAANIAKFIKKIKFIKFLGVNSLFILAFHTRFYRVITYSTVKFLNRTFGIIQQSMLWGLVYVILTILVAIPLIMFINKYIPFLVGKKKSKNIMIEQSETI